MNPLVWVLPGKQILNTMNSSLFGLKMVLRNLLVLFMLLGANLYGATYPVSSAGQFETAIGAVNVSSEDDTIMINANIVLDALLPQISKAVGNLTIEGNGHTLNRNSSALEFRVLYIVTGTVNIDHLTISGGNSGPGHGGGIYVDSGMVILTNCTVSGNSVEYGGSYYGGGIYVDSGTVTLTNCAVLDNRADWGGGIYNSSGTLTLTSCTVSDNRAEYAGGICSSSGTLTLTNCTVSGNEALNGAGVYNSSTVTLTNCTVSNNAATLEAGGIYNSGTLTLSNCTVSTNSAAQGAGISNFGNMTLIRSMVSGNSGGSYGGAEIFQYGGNTTADSNNVFGHSGLTTAQALDGFVPGGTDVTCTSDGSNTALGSILNASLADNGGPTQTHALVAGSPAIDIASTGPATDQRGISRPQGSGVDAGAYEFVPSDPDPIGEFNYRHNLVSNTAKLNAWVLDPDARLGVGANWTMEGDLSRGFRFVDGMLVGMFDTTGTHVFRISGTDGIITVNHSFTVRVLAPTLCPTIFGGWINGQYLAIEVIEDACHGVAAQTSTMQVTLEGRQATEIRFDWDYIKDGFSFRIIDGTLPPGLILDGRSGVISGVPRASGSFRFLVSVKDWRGRGYQWVDVDIP